MNLFKINTQLVDKFSSLLTLALVISMVAFGVKYVAKGSIGKALLSLLFFALLLWGVNDLDGFISVLKSISEFLKGMLQDA